jgi:hypothetical protein
VTLQSGCELGLSLHGNDWALFWSGKFTQLKATTRVSVATIEWISLLLTMKLGLWKTSQLLLYWLRYCSKGAFLLRRRLKGWISVCKLTVHCHVIWWFQCSSLCTLCRKVLCVKGLKYLLDKVYYSMDIRIAKLMSAVRNCSRRIYMKHWVWGKIAVLMKSLSGQSASTDLFQIIVHFCKKSAKWREYCSQAPNKCLKICELYTVLWSLWNITRLRFQNTESCDQNIRRNNALSRQVQNPQKLLPRILTIFNYSNCSLSLAACYYF